MPVFHTKTIESILDPVAQQVNNKHITLNGQTTVRICFLEELVYKMIYFTFLHTTTTAASTYRAHKPVGKS